MKRYEIYDQDEGGALRFDLRSILLDLPEGGRFRIWKLILLEAIGPEVLALEAKVAGTTDGLTLSWQSLLQLAESFEQVVNLRLSSVDQSISESDGKASVLVLEVFDSTFWSLETNLEAVVAWLCASFRDVRSVESASV